MTAKIDRTRSRTCRACGEKKPLAAFHEYAGGARRRVCTACFRLHCAGEASELKRTRCRKCRTPLVLELSIQRGYCRACRPHERPVVWEDVAEVFLPHMHGGIKQTLFQRLVEKGFQSGYCRACRPDEAEELE